MSVSSRYVAFLGELAQSTTPHTVFNMANVGRHDKDVAAVVDEMILQPDIATHLFWRENHLTDETGLKLARFVAVSTKLEWVDLVYNDTIEKTIIAIADALRVNRSVRVLQLNGNRINGHGQAIRDAFVEALRINPKRPEGFYWSLFGCHDSYASLRKAADELHVRVLE